MNLFIKYILLSEYVTVSNFNNKVASSLFRLNYYIKYHSTINHEYHSLIRHDSDSSLDLIGSSRIYIEN